MQKYWKDILSELQNVLIKKLDLSQVSLLLGLMNNVLTFCAHIKILMHWIRDKAPSMLGWHRAIMEYIPLDFLTCLLHSKTNAFDRT